MSLFECAQLDAGLAGTVRDPVLLDRWVAQGWLRSLDRAFAHFLGREVPGVDPLVLLAAALASYQLGRGHVCLDLQHLADAPARTLGLPEATPMAVLQTVALDAWQTALANCPELCVSGAGNTPLVLVGPRLYLRRNWHYERTVFDGIGQRLQAPVSSSRNPGAVHAILDGLFANDPLPAGQTVHWQKVACGVAATRAFSIITGGPGTGKTTTVVKLLALLQALQRDASASGTPQLAIKLAAPTGKAAARLSESITHAIQGLNLTGLPDAEAIRSAIPREVTTLHRLLGRRPGTRRPTYGRGHPLPLDLLVIDEASMIDLEMMAAVINALPDNARLILLGDKDQLASVEAGAVLGELCRHAESGRYRESTAAVIVESTGERLPGRYLDPDGSDLDQAVVMLRHSYRFPPDKGIGQLAVAVNAGQAERVAALFAAGHAELAMLDPTSGAAFNALVIEGANPDGLSPLVSTTNGPTARCGYRHYLTTLRDTRPARYADDAAWDAWARAVLRAHNAFQLLAAVRQGPCGVEALNTAIAGLLCKKGLIARTDGWYEGRPVMITHNDYTLGLMNGDVGIALERPGAEPGTTLLRVAFPTADGIKWVSPTRLTEVETVYALTVHKSQGSEFTHTLLVLPEMANPILTRELFYTAITRSRTWLSLCNPGGALLLEACVKNRVVRASGLLEGG